MPERKISRREFLRGMGGGLALVMSWNVWNVVYKRFLAPEIRQMQEVWNFGQDSGLAEANPKLYLYLTEHPALVEPLMEAISFRKRLGFSKSLPPEIVDYDPYWAEEEWGRLGAAFTNELAENMVMVTEITRGVVEAALGRGDSFKMVKGVRGGGPSGQLGFGPLEDDREMAWPEDYFPSVSDVFLTDYHECLGHGTDPTDLKYVKPEIFMELLAGKWQALSQAYSVEGEFLNHPSDNVRPTVEIQLGEKIALAMARGEMRGLEGEGLIWTAVDQTVVELNLDRTRVILTKNFCLELGKKVLRLILAGEKLFVSGDYENVLDGNIAEIYAEMVKWSLATPDLFSGSLADSQMNEEGKRSIEKVQGNSYISAGVERVLAAVNQEKTIVGEVRKRLNVLRENFPETLPKVQDFEPLKTLPLSQTNNLPLTPVAPATAEQKAEARANWDLDEFLKNGILPDLSGAGIDEDYRQLLAEYLSLCAAVAQKYPRFADENIFIPEAIVAFDPLYLNFWESEAITEAGRKSFLVSLFYSLNQGDDLSGFREHIEGNIDVLRQFVAREEFVAAPEAN